MRDLKVKGSDPTPDPDGKCPEDYYQDGVDENGNPICKEIPPEICEIMGEYFYYDGKGGCTYCPLPNVWNTTTLYCDCPPGMIENPATHDCEDPVPIPNDCRQEKTIANGYKHVQLYTSLTEYIWTCECADSSAKETTFHATDGTDHYYCLSSFIPTKLCEAPFVLKSNGSCGCPNNTIQKGDDCVCPKENMVLIKPDYICAEPTSGGCAIRDCYMCPSIVTRGSGCTYYDCDALRPGLDLEHMVRFQVNHLSCE